MAPRRAAGASRRIPSAALRFVNADGALAFFGLSRVAPLALLQDSLRCPCGYAGTGSHELLGQRSEASVS